MPISKYRAVKIWSGWEAVLMQVLQLNQSPDRAIRQFVLKGAGTEHMIMEEKEPFFWLKKE